MNSLATLEGQLDDLVAGDQTESRAGLRAGHRYVVLSLPKSSIFSSLLSLLGPLPWKSPFLIRPQMILTLTSHLLGLTRASEPTSRSPYV